MRPVLVVLLLAATALFAVGAIAERSQVHEPTGAEVHTTGEAAGESPAVHQQEQTETSGESNEAHANGAAAETHTEASETVLGVNVESTPLIVLAVLVGLGLAALVASRFGRSPAVMIAVALIAIAWAALDVREVVHQLDESRTGIAAIAIAVAVLHLAAALLAARIAARAGVMAA
jgi:F0F1-type ATP synthase assembly protein I